MNFFVTLIYLCTNLSFASNFLCLPVINSSSSTRVLLRETLVNLLKSRTQSMVMQSGKNKFRKKLTCSMPWGRKEYLSEVS